MKKDTGDLDKLFEVYMDPQEVFNRISDFYDGNKWYITNYIAKTFKELDLEKEKEVKDRIFDFHKWFSKEKLHSDFESLLTLFVAMIRIRELNGLLLIERQIAAQAVLSYLFEYDIEPEDIYETISLCFNNDGRYMLTYIAYIIQYKLHEAWIFADDTTELQIHPILGSELKEYKRVQKFFNWFEIEKLKTLSNLGQEYYQQRKKQYIDEITRREETSE